MGTEPSAEKTPDHMGIQVGEIEQVENLVDGVQIQGGTAEDAAAYVALARDIQGGGIQVERIGQAGSIVSGVQFLGAGAPTSVAELRQEVAELQAQVQQAITAGEIESAGDAEDVQEALETANQELEKPQPDGKRVVRKLSTVTDVLIEAAETAQAAGKAGLQILKLAPIAAALSKLAVRLLGG